MQEVLEKLIVIPVAIVVALVMEGLKKAGIGVSKDATKNYYPLITMALGIAFTMLWDLSQSGITVTTLFVGIVSGWASNGLYDVLSAYLPLKKNSEA